MACWNRGVVMLGQGVHDTERGALGAAARSSASICPRARAASGAPRLPRGTSDKVKTIFVQPQFDQTSAAALAESIDGNVAKLDPLEKDIIANLRKFATAIKSSY